MQVTIDPSLDADTYLRAAVVGRAAMLEGVINGTATAEWRKANDWSGQPAAQLRLHDPSGARVAAYLTPDEVFNPAKAEDRIRNLKDALASVRDWRAVVARFFVTIRPWLETLPGNPTVTEQPLRVAEGESGEYDISELIVSRGRWPLRIYPRAAWVVGWEGLVMLGDNPLYYSRAQDAWYCAPNKGPYREIPLTEELFRELAEGSFGA